MQDPETASATLAGAEEEEEDAACPVCWGAPGHCECRLISKPVQKGEVLGAVQN